MENNPNTPALSEAKKSNWLKTAEKSQMLDISLQSKAEKIKTALSALPTLSTAEAIAGYESVLKKAKQDKEDLISERKEFTSILDTVISLKMKYEKEVTGDGKMIIGVIKPYEDALLKVKKDKKTADDLKKAKDDEIAALKLSFVNHITQQRAIMETAIINKVGLMFEAALKSAKPVEELSAYLAENTMREDDFKCAQLTLPNVHVTGEEAAVIKREIWEANKINPTDMVKRYTDAILDKFGSPDSNFWLYALSLKNADDALALSKTEQTAQLAATNDTSLNVQVANKLQTVSVPVVAVGAKVKTRALKKVWVLDMENSEATAITLLTAFVANWALCKPKLRIHDAALMNLSINQMGAALLAVKNDDEKFEVTGVKFKVEEKL